MTRSRSAGKCNQRDGPKQHHAAQMDSWRQLKPSGAAARKATLCLHCFKSLPEVQVCRFEGVQKYVVSRCCAISLWPWVEFNLMGPGYSEQQFYVWLTALNLSPISADLWCHALPHRFQASRANYKSLRALEDKQSYIKTKHTLNIRLASLRFITARVRLHSRQLDPARAQCSIIKEQQC